MSTFSTDHLTSIIFSLHASVVMITLYYHDWSPVLCCELQHWSQLRVEMEDTERINDKLIIFGDKFCSQSHRYNFLLSIIMIICNIMQDSILLVVLQLSIDRTTVGDNYKVHSTRYQSTDSYSCSCIYQEAVPLSSVESQLQLSSTGDY